METEETLRARLRERPFQPFRVHLKSGETYDIRYPRINLVARSFVKIGILSPDSPKPPKLETISCHHTEFVWLADIDRIEPLSEPPAIPGNKEAHP